MVGLPPTNIGGRDIASEGSSATRPADAGPSIKPQPRAALLDAIPGELRNRIMRYLLKPETPVRVHSPYDDRGNVTKNSLVIPRRERLQVCRQLRYEL